MYTSLGKYQPYNTFIHKMDARVKLVTMIILMVSVFMTYSQNSFMNLTIYAVLFVSFIIISLLAKVSFLSIFRSLAAIWVMIIFVLILNVFFTKPSLPEGVDPTPYIAFSIGALNIYWLSIVNLLYVIARLVLIIMITNIFTSSTKPMEMTNALEWLLWPLGLIRIPLHKFAMAISLALRFTPTLQEETDRIMKAQASRGVDYKQGKFKEKIKALVALIIPLFMSAFTTSGQLADAMEARGYDPNAKRTRYKTNHWGLRDFMGCLFATAWVAGIVLLCVYQPDIYAFFNVPLPLVK
ncbi:MAG: energy-coupling factor transporter transmembrane protein EcfT [Bacilli bacterium]|nr:energy-coupling factor transporter transmembrane protein EcfT [Bacilli bacterium]